MTKTPSVLNNVNTPKLAGLGGVYATALANTHLIAVRLPDFDIEPALIQDKDDNVTIGDYKFENMSIDTAALFYTALTINQAIGIKWEAAFNADDYSGSLMELNDIADYVDALFGGHSSYVQEMAYVIAAMPPRINFREGALFTALRGDYFSAAPSALAIISTAYTQHCIVVDDKKQAVAEASIRQLVKTAGEVFEKSWQHRHHGIELKSKVTQ